MRPQRALVLILMAALCSFPCWAEDGASEASNGPMPATSDIRDEEGTSEDFNEEEKALREALKDAAKEAKASLHEAAKAAHAHYKDLRKNLHEAEKAERPDDLNGINNAIRRVDEATAKHIQRLEAIIEKAPESAKTGLLNAMSASQHGRATALTSLYRVRDRLMARSGQQDQPGRMVRHDKPDRSGKFERPEKPEKPNRPERPEKPDRPGNGR